MFTVWSFLPVKSDHSIHFSPEYLRTCCKARLTTSWSPTTTTPVAPRLTPRRTNPQSPGSPSHPVRTAMSYTRDSRGLR